MAGGWCAVSADGKSNFIMMPARASKEQTAKAARLVYALFSLRPRDAG
jgi:hypothetical protein